MPGDEKLPDVDWSGAPAYVPVETVAPAEPVEERLLHAIRHIHRPWI